MRRLCGVLLTSFFLLPVVASAQNQFDGTWKVDMNKVDFPKKPDVYLVQNGMYECKSCVPAINIKADGQDQKVTGHPYYDSMAVKIVSDHEVEETDKRDGKVVGTSKMTVSPDGKTMTFAFTDSSNSSGTPVTGSGEAERIAKGPAGANAISGSWRTTKMQNISDNAITWTYKFSGDEVTMSSPTGITYTAKLNGTEAPMKGDPGVSTVSVKMMGKDTLVETDSRDGKVVSITKSSIASDGKTLHIVNEDKVHGTTMKYEAMKQ